MFGPTRSPKWMLFSRGILTKKGCLACYGGPVATSFLYEGIRVPQLLLPDGGNVDMEAAQ